MRPRLLDLFCGAGGATRGYQDAGFYVIGVDINPQPDYCGDEFYKDDAMQWLGVISRRRPVRPQAIHASPPCQLWSRAGRLRDAQNGTAGTGDLLTPTMALLRDVDIPWVVENVPGAPLTGVTLCGSSFGLKVRRHRIFASNVLLTGLPCDHKAQGRPVGVYHVMGDDIPHGGRTARNLAEAQEAMGIDWMPWKSLKEAIPPAYTEHIGAQLMAYVTASA